MCEVCDPKKKYGDCICQENWKNFNNTLKEINKIEYSILKKPLKISTITLCFNFNCFLCFDTIRKKFNNNITNKTSKLFYNCIILEFGIKYQSKLKASIKIFSNGKIQVAGLQTIMGCAYCIRKLFKRFSEKNIFLEIPTINNVRIVMINSDFKINKYIMQDELCLLLINQHILKGGKFTSVIFQPSKYPAINTKIITDRNKNEYLEHIKLNGVKKKYKNLSSILIFRSGSIIITGGKNLQDYLEFYTLIMNILIQNANVLLFNN